jgi:Ca2+-binding RTX toxin-like protein
MSSSHGVGMTIEGDDVLRGAGGDDVLDGGDGNDDLDGGAGTDYVGFLDTQPASPSASLPAPRRVTGTLPMTTRSVASRTSSDRPSATPSPGTTPRTPCAGTWGTTRSAASVVMTS